MLASTTQSQTLGISVSTRIATAVFSAVFGSVLLYFVAFAHADILHNGAHDTRHAIVAPCH